MKFRTALNILPAGFIMLASSLSAGAAKLPTRVVNGEECFYHEVKPKETIYGLCKEFGITKAQLVQYNPSVADGLRAGAVLYFPVASFPELGTEPTASEEYSTKSKKPKVYLGESDDNTATYRKGNVHHVEKGETIYGICKRYGISESELMQLNPSLNKGLKHGTLLMLPDSCQEPDELVTQPAPAMEQPAVPAEPAPVVEAAVPDVPAIPIQKADTSAVSIMPTPAVTGITPPSVTDAEKADTSSVDSRSTNIAVILPFMLGDDNPDKQAQLYTEFYKGLLLAADSLRHHDRPITIRAYDSSASLDSVVRILGRDEIADVNVIIPPDDDDQLDAIARFARERNAAVFNIFAVKNDSYLSNPDILQANITHSAVYPKAIDEFIRLYPQYTPVFLTGIDGKSDKKEFTSMLREQLRIRGREYIDLTYTSYLKESDLASLDSDGWYVFIPESGTSSEFSHIAGALKTFRESHADYNQVRLFGYPEWITFRGNSLENLHTLDATVYSRFYNDDNSYRSRDIAEKYKKWYGNQMISAVPVQGILGFDAGYYMLKSLQDNHGDIINTELHYDGVQSGFHFSVKGGSAGKVNDTLYFIEFRPSGLIDKHSVE